MTTIKRSMALVAAVFMGGIFNISAASAQDKLLVPLNSINPEIYQPTKASRKIDPNDKILQGFRDRKAKDLANPNMPRPFSISDYGRAETRDTDVPWEDLSKIFKYAWKILEFEAPAKVAQLKKAVKARVIFSTPDVKIIELAVAPGGILPSFSQAAPSAYHVLEGSAKFTSGTKTAEVFDGTSIKVEPNNNVRIQVTSKTPLKLLWFSWAPGGDERYLSAGYYLTGANFQVQPEEAEIPKNFAVWEKNRKFKILSDKSNKKLVERKLYPKSPTFRSKIDDNWLDFTALTDGGFFWAADLKRMGSLMGVIPKIVRMTGLFRASVPGGQYDFNFSYIVWGPHSKYITHSHATPEFYYILTGKTKWMLGGPKGHTYIATPGNIYFHPPYQDHEMLGLGDEPLIAITGSWAPYGDRSVFRKPFVLNEALPDQKRSAVFPKNFKFNHFKDLKKDLKYGPNQ
ncbi:hypothetical protein MNB_SV-10-732 [hydrothermal vent metagenome]|uniref:Cupin type-2 domain-containing protein n=1 Tax=hydrothermal vent metagenome TaxID=652676 RepID=A0A1W1CHB1_9ZZZZ